MNTIAARIRKILFCSGSTYCVYSLYLSHTESAVALNVFKDWYQNNNNVKIAIAIETSTKDTTISINNNIVPEKKQDKEKVVFEKIDFFGGENQATAIIVATKTKKVADKGNANPKAEKDEAERQRFAAAAASQMIGDFDFSQSGIPCGSQKCFIPSKTLNSKFGYLIGENKHEAFQVAYEFGRHLQERFGIPNILLGPPQSIGSDSNVTEQINQKTYKLANGNGNNRKIFESKTLTIAKARTIPFDDNNNTFFLKCDGSTRLNRTRFLWKDFQQSLSDIASSGGGRGKGGGWLSLRRGSRDNKDLFLRQFQESIDQLSLVIKNEPLFVYDLQFLVTTEGQMHHMDYDRIIEAWKSGEKSRQRDFNHKMSKHWEECLDFLHEMKHDAVLDLTTTTER